MEDLLQINAVSPLAPTDHLTISLLNSNLQNLNLNKEQVLQKKMYV